MLVARHQWLMPIILATQEAEIRRITVRSQPRQMFTRPYLKIPFTKNRAGKVAQSEGPKFKPQYHKTKMLAYYKLIFKIHRIKYF
jgi:hypothetical protein